MATRKVSHHTRIKGKTSIQLSKAKPGTIIEFKYRNESNDNYDKTPLVFVLSKSGKVLNGINIGYMKEYKVEKLLEETNFKKLKHYSLYEDSFRTYNKSKITMVKLIEFKTKEVQREENKTARAQGKDDEVEL
tara:strand:- start:55 stop:453 length:399 start_codon:yes stop_codon:yes gene_type:complete